MYKNVLAYADDIIIYSENIEDHIKTLKKVFELIRKGNLTLQRQKCQIAKKQVSFLGMVFQEGQMQVDPKKVELSKECKPPTNKKMLRSFLGMTTFLRRFIKDYSKIARPLYNLLKKDITYK